MNLKRKLVLIITIAILVLAYFAFLTPGNSMAGGYAYGEQLTYSQLEQLYINLCCKYSALIAPKPLATKQQVLDFIESDRTNEKVYSEWACFEFSQELMDNARGEGFKCGRVLLSLGWQRYHAVNVFYYDGGKLYVEPQNDYIIPDPMWYNPTMPIVVEPIVDMWEEIYN